MNKEQDGDNEDKGENEKRKKTRKQKKRQLGKKLRRQLGLQPCLWAGYGEGSAKKAPYRVLAGVAEECGARRVCDELRALVRLANERALFGLLDIHYSIINVFIYIYIYIYVYISAGPSKEGASGCEICLQS